MNIVDTHAHLYLEEFEDDIKDIVNRALNAGIVKIIQPSIDSNYTDRMLNLEGKYPSLFRSMIGLHPNSVDKNYSKEIDKVEHWLSKKQFVAIGEIGIDLYRSDEYLNEQREAFIHQIELANKFDLPIVIHCRNAFKEILDILEVQPFELKGIIHCFYGDLEQANRFINLGIKLGIGGILTFKDDELFNKLLLDVGLENVVLETDSPYLSPKPYRGKRNESSYITHIADKLAGIYGISLEKLSYVTTKNAYELFGLKG